MVANDATKARIAQRLSDQHKIGVRWNIRYQCYEIDTESRSYATVSGLRAAIRRHKQYLQAQARNVQVIGPQSVF